MRQNRNRTAVYCIVEVRCSSPLEFDHFKIGIADNPIARLSGLQTGCPHRLALLFSEWLRSREEARSVEKNAHTFLANYSVRGEWFRHAPGEHGCPFEAFSRASSALGYVPAADFYFDHPEPDYQPVLLDVPERWDEGTKRARLLQ